MGTARIASVHFAPVAALRNYIATAYEIPSVKVFGAEPNMLEVDDLVQKDWGSITHGPGGGRRQELRYLVTGEEIARDIVDEWTQSGRAMTPTCHPGIWVVRDRIAVMVEDPKTGEPVAKLDHLNRQVFRVPTNEERETMWAEDVASARFADRSYAEWCWSDGNKIAEKTKDYQLVPPNYKLAARHYGLDADWLRQAAAIDSRPCPSCGKLGPKQYFICQFCQQPTDMERWASWQAQKDAALKDATREIRDASLASRVAVATKPQQAA